MSWQPVLDFWFGDLIEGFASEPYRQRWFATSEETDRACKALAAPLLDQAAGGALTSWLDKPKSALAFIVLCDQFPRNSFRGEARAFAWDPLALDAARNGVRDGMDRELTFDERSFFYLPFEHSEDLIDQHTAVGLFAQLRDETPGPHKEKTGNALRYAHIHRDLILRFGRFPHRNSPLGRASTLEELDYLKNSDGFGQGG